MRTLYESLLDTDKELAEKSESMGLFPYFAECFVKIFGKIDRNYVNLDHRQGAPQRIGKIEVKDWKWKNTNDNEFMSKVREMITMIKKRYSKLLLEFDSNMQHAAIGIWKIRYTINFKLFDYDFDWCVDVIKEHDKIVRLIFFYLHTRAYKNKELLKIIDDNI